MRIGEFAKVFVQFADGVRHYALEDDGEFFHVGPELCQGVNADAIVASSGVDLIAAERLRQIRVEGWDAAHDDGHVNGQLAAAAGCYALQAAGFSRPDRNIGDHPFRGAVALWPWSRLWWKPSVVIIRNLVKAGALIAAEIDRLKRQEGSDS